MLSVSKLAYDVCGLDHESAEELLDSWLSNSRFSLAYGLLCEGFSVIPLLSGGKMPAVKWKKYQTELATVEDLVRWFIENDFEPAIVTGELSGITVIDCDNIDAIDACLDSGIESRMTQKTNRGMHFVFRYNGERNTVRVNGMHGVDRRGEGGYVRAYPDCGCWTSEGVMLCPTL
jgi:hypothetical protein